MKRRMRAAWVSVWLLWGLPGLAAAAHINAVVIDGSINPASSDHIQQAISLSEQDGALAVLVELDTPGGLLGATKDIVQSMLNARVPVIVFVSPQGAWAASAGAFITLAGHVAAMAPGTSIGAASPVSAFPSSGGDERGEDDERQDVALEKVEKFSTAFIESIAKERKRNVEWAQRAVREAEAIAQDEALKLGVIDLVARDREDLLEQLEGREVEVAGEIRTLHLADAEVRVIEMAPLTRLFDFLANPQVAILLAMAGLAGLYIEFNQPGMLVPGIAGALCLILAAIAFQILPFSWVGLLVVLLGLGLMVAEIFVTSYGALFAAGLACLLLGGSMLFDMPEVSDLTVPFWSVLVPIVVAFGIIAGLVVFAVSRSFMRQQTAGVEELVGLVGKAVDDLTPEGRIFVHGEHWNATADEAIQSGQPVQITAVEGLRVRVRRPQSEG